MSHMTTQEVRNSHNIKADLLDFAKKHYATIGLLAIGAFGTGMAVGNHFDHNANNVAPVERTTGGNKEVSADELNLQTLVFASNVAKTAENASIFTRPLNEVGQDAFGPSIPVETTKKRAENGQAIVTTNEVKQHFANNPAAEKAASSVLGKEFAEYLTKNAKLLNPSVLDGASKESPALIALAYSKPVILSEPMLVETSSLDSKTGQIKKTTVKLPKGHQIRIGVFADAADKDDTVVKDKLIKNAKLVSGGNPDANKSESSTEETEFFYIYDCGCINPGVPVTEETKPVPTITPTPSVKKYYPTPTTPGQPTATPKPTTPPQYPTSTPAPKVEHGPAPGPNSNPKQQPEVKQQDVYNSQPAFEERIIKGAPTATPAPQQNQAPEQSPTATPQPYNPNPNVTVPPAPSFDDSNITGYDYKSNTIYIG